MTDVAKSIKIASTRKRVARERLSEAKSSSHDSGMTHGSVGQVTTYGPKRGRGRPRMAEFGVTTNHGGVYVDPVSVLAGKILSATVKPPRMSVCTVYDAEGKPIATIDPHTRVRTPLA